MRMDNDFPQQMLPVWLESGQQGICDVRQGRLLPHIYQII
jgi:hypothetical protein